MAWNSEGTHFAMLDKTKFISEILPIHFKHQKYSSFLRQMNLYGFEKARINGQVYFYHKFFQKNQKYFSSSRDNLICNRSLITQITRKLSLNKPDEESKKDPEDTEIRTYFMKA